MRSEPEKKHTKKDFAEKGEEKVKEREKEEGKRKEKRKIKYKKRRKKISIWKEGKKEVYDTNTSEWRRCGASA